MQDRTLQMKKKGHLSTHFLKTEHTNSQSFDLQMPKTPNLPNLPKITDNSLQKLSISKEKSSFTNFFIKKDFINFFTENAIKTDSISNEKNLKNLISHSIERKNPIKLNKLHNLPLEILTKNPEKLINLPKFTKNLENFLLKITEKLSVFPEFYQEIKRNTDEIEEFLYKSFKEAFASFESLVQENKEKSERILSLNKAFEEKKLHYSSEINEYFKKVNELAEDQYKKVHKKTSLNEIYTNFEKQKLEKEVDLLRNSLKTVEQSHNVEEIIEKFRIFKGKTDQNIEELSTNNQKKEVLIFQMSGQINVLKVLNNKLEKELNSQQEISRDFKAKNEKIDKEKDQYFGKSSRFKEIALMQKEDCDVFLMENLKNKKLIHALELKLKEIKKKLGYNMELLSNLNEDESESDNNLMKKVSNFMKKEYVKSLIKIEKEAKTATFPFSKIEESDFSEEISLSRFQYYKPGFATLIQIEPLNKNDPVSLLKKLTKNAELKISPMFLATLRAVLDSKYNEILINEDYKQITKFPEFVYSWLSTFYVSSSTRTVKLIDLDKTPDLDNLREEFLLTLSSPLMSKLWECVNFKEFIEEKSSIDELYFYLHCRFLINKGPQIASDGSTFTYIQFVRNEEVQKLVDLLLINYDEISRSFIKEKLQEKAKFKNQHLLIDSAFVLRIFLEYYRLERKYRYKTLKNLFISLPPDQKIKKKIAINSFKSFKNLIEKLNANTTESDKAELFRECYQIGLGEINPEIFFTVLTETGFFVSTLKLRSFLNANLTTNAINQEDYLNVTENLMKKMNDKEAKIAIKNVRNIVEEIGCEKMMFFWEKNLKVFSENYRFIDFEMLCGKIPDLNFLNIVKIAIIAKNVKNFNSHLKNDEYSECNEVFTEWDVWENLLNSMKKTDNRDRIKEFEKNKKIRIIQEFTRKKIQKWYVLINKLLKRKK